MARAASLARLAVGTTLIGVLLTGCQTTEPEILPSPTTSPRAAVTSQTESATPEVSAQPAPPPTLAPWARADVPAFLDPIGSSSVRALAERDGRLVAVGQVGIEPGIWVSDSLGSWEHVDLPDDRHGDLAKVAAADAGWVALGPGYDETGEGVVALYSPDGRSWQPASVAWDGYLDTVALGSDGHSWLLVAIGEEGRKAMSSSNGVHWQAGGSPPIDEVTDITYLDGGWIVAGTQATDNGWEGVLYASPDGSSWKQLSTPPGSGAFSDLTRTRDRYVAAGSLSADEGGAALWTSPDLETWTRVDLPNAENERRTTIIRAVAGSEDLLVAVGDDAEGRIGVWESSDGTSWQHDDSDAFDTEEGRTSSAAVALRGEGVEVFADTPLDDPSFRSVVGLWTSPPAAATLPARWTPPSPGCPRGKVNLLDVAALTPKERLDCFGDRKITMTGYVSGFECGDVPDPGEPRWLADPCSSVLVPVPGSPHQLVFVEVHAEPDSKARQFLNDVEGHRLKVTGSFDSPKATECQPPAGESAASAVEQCRQHFVVKQVERAAR
jgi:hypothetical protein